jgi:purine-nucleoside phosphorylase
MVIEDHVFLPGLAGHTPLRGPNLGMFGPRFSSHTHAYSPELRRLAHEAAATRGIPLRQGVYISLAGPAFETPAEVRMLRAWGGDAVGMSTGPEVLVASHAGMRVLGLSTITNKSIDSTEAALEVSHEEVLRLGRRVVPRLAILIRTVLRELPPYDPAAAENHPES